MLRDFKVGFSDVFSIRPRSRKTVLNALSGIVLSCNLSSAYSQSWREALKRFDGEPRAAHSAGVFGSGMYVLDGLTGQITDDILYNEENNPFLTAKFSLNNGYVFDINSRAWTALPKKLYKNMHYGNNPNMSKLKSHAGYSGKIEFLPNGDLYSLDEVRPYLQYIHDPDPTSGNAPELDSPRGRTSILSANQVWESSYVNASNPMEPFNSNRFQNSHLISFLQTDGSVITLDNGQELRKFNPSSVTSNPYWQVLTTTNQPSAKHATHGFQAIQIENKIYVWGGIDEESLALDTKVHILDLTSLSWTDYDVADAPLGRVESKAFRYGEKIVFFGGNGLDDTYFDGGILDTANMKWVSIPSPKKDSGIQFASLLFYSVNLWKNKLIVWGGSMPDNLVSSGAILDLETLEWEKMPDANISARALHSGSVIDDKLIIWGGSGEGFNALSDGGVYDLKSNQWLD